MADETSPTHCTNTCFTHCPRKREARKEYGLQVQQARKGAGMSQNQLAKRCETTQGLISQIEQGTRTSARVKNIIDKIFDLS